MKCTILAGPSGAGKSTYAETFKPPINAEVVSADDFFTTNNGYEFKPEELPAAHNYCMRRFVEICQEMARSNRNPETKHIIVDNTNTTVAEIAPYYQVAQAYGFEVEVIVFILRPAKAAARNVHGVPEIAVLNQSARISELRSAVPPWWKVTYRDAS